MSISQALSNATSGLSAASFRASVASNNIANALTEGYSRRDVSLAERVTGGVGAGVMVAGIARAGDPAITYERRIADGEFARDDAIASALVRLGDALGGPEDAGSLFAKYAALESKLRLLADAPDSGAAQNAVVSAARDLTAAFHRIAESHQTLRMEADAEIAARVMSVNEDLKAVENLNGAISRGVATGTDVSALQDQRQHLIDRINESAPVRELQRGDGRIDLMTPEGVFLLAGEARTLSFDPSPVITAQNVYAGGAGSLSGLSVDGVDITPGGPSTQAPRAGAFAGLFAIRDTIAPDASRTLDALALDLAERFSEPGLDPTVPAGAPGLFTDAGALAAPSALDGLAGRLAVNAAADPALGGEPRRIRDGLGAIAPAAAGSDGFVRALISAMNDGRPADPALKAAGELNAAEAAAHVASLIGAARGAATSTRDSSRIMAANLAEAEISVAGVDTDRELQALLAIEQAYAANARVIETVDRMMQRLMDI